MSQFAPSDYHFCTLNELQSPKPLPSLDFVAKLVEICYVPMTLFESSQRNIYDRKNHILYINNYDSYTRALKEKYNRSVASFEKQLKMMGFKKRKIKQHSAESMRTLKQQQSQQLRQMRPENDQEESKREDRPQNILIEQQQKNKNANAQVPEHQKSKIPQQKCMFIWRTNRSALIEKQFCSFEEALTREISKAVTLKEQMQKRKRQLDVKLETIICQSLLNANESENSEVQTEMIGPECGKGSIQKMKSETILENYFDFSLKELKLLSNQTQIQAKQFVQNISLNLSSQLQLYRMLIYKQTHIHRSIEEQ